MSEKIHQNNNENKPLSGRAIALAAITGAILAAGGIAAAAKVHNTPVAESSASSD